MCQYTRSSNNSVYQNNRTVENKNYSDIPADIAEFFKGNEDAYYMLKDMGETDDEIREGIARNIENNKITGGNRNGIHTY